jgi:hypothetical protein
MIQPNTTVEGFIRGRNTVQVLNTPLMDANATLRFTLINSIGLMALLVEHGTQNFNQSSMRINDDTTYDFASAAIEFGE